MHGGLRDPLLVTRLGITAGSGTGSFPRGLFLLHPFGFYKALLSHRLSVQTERRPFLPFFLKGFPGRGLIIPSKVRQDCFFCRLPGLTLSSGSATS